MAMIDVLTDKNLRDTQEDLLIMRMLDSFATNTRMKELIKNQPEFGFYYGEPPRGKVNLNPGLFLWISSDRPTVNAQGSVFFSEMQVSLKVTLQNSVTAKPMARDNDGIRTERFYNVHTPVREIYAIKKALRTVLETHGYDNKWWYTWVQDGCKGGPNQIEINYTAFGGDMTGGQGVQDMTLQFKVVTEIEEDAEIFVGDLEVTVSDGAVVENAKVWVKDATGHYVEDSSGNHIWKTNVLGVATATGLYAQKGCTVYAENSDGSKAGNTASQLIPNDDTLTLTQVISA